MFNHFRYVAGEIVTVTGNTKILEPRRFTRDAHGNVLSSVDCDADDTMFASFETDRGVIGDIAASWSGHGQPLLTGTVAASCTTHGTEVSSATNWCAMTERATSWAVFTRTTANRRRSNGTSRWD